MIVIIDKTSRLNASCGIICSVETLKNILYDVEGIALYDTNNEQLYVKL